MVSSAWISKLTKFDWLGIFFSFFFHFFFIFFSVPGVIEDILNSLHWVLSKQTKNKEKILARGLGWHNVYDILGLKSILHEIVNTLYQTFFSFQGVYEWMKHHCKLVFLGYRLEMKFRTLKEYPSVTFFFSLMATS